MKPASTRQPAFVALIACLLVISLSPSAPALTDDQRTRASGLFADYRDGMSRNQRDAATAAIQGIIADLPTEASTLARRQILLEAEALTRGFIADVEALLARHDTRVAQRDPQVVKDRALIASILATRGDDAQKKRLAEEGWPAIERLQATLIPDPRKLIEADAALVARRDAILFRLDLCDTLAKRAGLPQDTAVRAKLDISAIGGAGLMGIATAKDRRVLADNREIAEAGTVPEVDVAGIEDANRLRMLAGLPALRTDPDLCKAALIHSKDMHEHNFFAHESPVKGRQKFTDRAREAGTTASGENIAMGQRDPIQANRGWFLSPGHFRNFFGNHARIGLGTHEGYYTQLFGG